MPNNNRFEDPEYQLHLRRMGNITPHARFVRKGVIYHSDYPPALIDHWIIVYDRDMIAHCSTLVRVPILAEQMRKDRKNWQKQHAFRGTRYYTPTFRGV
jgi:hypothetical protein